MNYLKMSKATDLSGRDKYLYRALEILPGFLSWGTLIALAALSYFQPVWVAVFLIFFNIYWLLMVVYFGLHLITAYIQLKKNLREDWAKKCQELGQRQINYTDKDNQPQSLTLDWSEVYQLVIFPFYKEDLEIIRSAVQAVADSGYPADKIILVLGVEERGGQEALARAETIKQEFAGRFKELLVAVHPGDIVGEQMGKGANQAWAAQQVKQQIIDPQGLDYRKILVSVFDIDTVATPGYFHILTYKFLTAPEPYRASYQPVPVYFNNIWQAPFFSRVAAASNTFWQMIQQARVERMATYSSHSITWSALADIGFWSTNMVSEDSRIFFHCFCFYKGNYRVEPLYFTVSMDACLDQGFWVTAKNLYKQQRRWGWGAENIPYLAFYTLKKWRSLPKGKFLEQIFVSQVYGFHSWATYALIIAVVGWLPLLIGGDAFNTTVLSVNLPLITRNLMMLANISLLVSAIVSILLLPQRPRQYRWTKQLSMLVQWLCLPITIILFGSFPALEAQTRLMFGKYMGFWLTPKKR